MILFDKEPEADEYDCIQRKAELLVHLDVAREVKVLSQESGVWDGDIVEHKQEVIDAVSNNKYDLRYTSAHWDAANFLLIILLHKFQDKC